MPNSSMKAILDSSVLIAFFAALDNPELLFSLKECGYEIYIPNGVLNELKKEETFQLLSSFSDKFTSLPEINIELLKLKFISLGQGELEVIFWGLKFEKEGGDYVCVLDDKRARNAAKKLGLNYTGTIGLLNMLKELGILTPIEKNNLLKKLREFGFRMPNFK